MNGEDVDRRMHWLRLARELGQEDDFRALMDDLRRSTAEEIYEALKKRRDEAQGAKQPGWPLLTEAMVIAGNRRPELTRE